MAFRYKFNVLLGKGQWKSDSSVENEKKNDMHEHEKIQSMHIIHVQYAQCSIYSYHADHAIVE